MKTTRRPLVFAAVMLAMTTTTAIAADFDLNWHTFDGGGGYSAGGDFDLEGTIGQPEAGFSEGGDFALVGGFWGAAVPPNPCPGDADGDLDVDITDLSILLSEFGLIEAGLEGDVDNDGDVDLSDLGLLLSQFGQTC